jgi:hypothetical protein
VLDGRPAPAVAYKEATWAFSVESSNSDLGDAVTGVAGHVSNSLYRKLLFPQTAFSLRPIWHRVFVNRGGSTIQSISDFQFPIADFKNPGAGFFNRQLAITMRLPTSFSTPGGRALISTLLFRH